ncbi:MAG: TonB-dependent receptor [Bacteroidetes bacterium]|nr:TonB-dependent receptor [Bacteroidota bacterium]
MLLYLFCATAAWAQHGQVEVFLTDSLGYPVPDALIKLRGNPTRYYTDTAGHCRIAKVPPGRHQLTARGVGYQMITENFELAAGETFVLRKIMPSLYTEGITVQGSTGKNDPDKPFERDTPIHADNVKDVTATKSDEKLIAQAMGAASPSEFSSQYRVRGGNYDENLIYINGIQLYRPQIVRSGQMEGLGIVNTAMVDHVTFSTGGFQARYDDRLSSVMNIRYLEPDSFRATAEIGLLTAGLHAGGRDKDREKNPGGFTWMVGARGFTMRYLLNSLDTDGNYQPFFWDFQNLLTWTPRRYRTLRYRERTRPDGRIDSVAVPPGSLKFGWLNVVQQNNYSFFPQSRETTFGTITRAFRLFVAFEGKEQSNYLTGQSAFYMDWRPNQRLSIRNQVGVISSEEAEIISVEGAYRLGDVSTDFGNERFNEVTYTRGVGSELRWARNFLNVFILQAEHHGQVILDRDLARKLSQADAYVRHKFSWGLRWQQDQVNDRFREWSATDSADFLRLEEQVRSRVTLHSWRTAGYVQEIWRTSRTTNLIAGLRANYWSLNEELLLSPRVQFVYDPSLRKYASDTLRRRNNYQLRLAAGAYHQPAFYRELRDFEGNLYTNRPAQRSYHFIAGGDYVFRMWRRDFKLFAEAYYKYMPLLYPFEFDNVRIRYYPRYEAEGYAYGIDARVNGQFIEGVESWFNVSWLRTQEQVKGLNQGYVRRPTDQNLLISFFFQDEFPMLPALKMHINLIYGSGLPFGPPTVLENRTVFRMPFYNRVDLGFSYEVRMKTQAALKPKSLWFGLDVFNLFARPNTVSYTWVKDVFNTRFAIPNYLSSRLLNVRVVATF